METVNQPVLDAMGVEPEPTPAPQQEPEKKKRGRPKKAVVPEAPPAVILQRAAEDIRAVFMELASRMIDALHLYEPMPQQDNFHRSAAPERIIWGSNRAGKTLPSCVELARAFTNRDPYKKYPDRDGRAYIVGKDGKHLGEVLYRKLLRPGAFSIMRDQLTNQWRAFRPWEDRDLELEHLKRPAPPLIPSRFVANIAWENKKMNQPSMTSFTTGWEANWYTSLGKPPQGGDIDIGYFDEEIIDPSWYTETAARLLDRHGVFFWSATPQSGTEKLWELHTRAEDEANKRISPVTVSEFWMQLADNPHISQGQKEALAKKYLDNPDEYQVRIGGHFAIVGYRFYPNFSDITHGIDPFIIPSDWTRYAVVDPGHQICAVLFVAVPPPKMDPKNDLAKWAGHKIIYDELYIPQCTAAMLGERMGQKCQGQTFQAFLIDSKVGKTSDTGSGLNVEMQYAAALKANGVRSVTTGNGFLWASNDFDAGIEATRTWLAPSADGLPTVLYIRGAVPMFRQNMERYHKKKVAGVITDRPVKKHDHQADNVRYLAMHGCQYVKQKTGESRPGYAWERVQQKLKKNRDREFQSGVNLGPGN